MRYVSLVTAIVDACWTGSNRLTQAPTKTCPVPMDLVQSHISLVVDARKHQAREGLEGPDGIPCGFRRDSTSVQGAWVTRIVCLNVPYFASRSTFYHAQQIHGSS